MMMEFTQMECGCTGNVFEQSYKQYAGAIVDENWATSIWAHHERCEAKVKITGLWKPKYGRENDNAIMETITASGMFRPVEIREINICRLYLQVFYTSDIADNSGKTLEPWVMKGKNRVPARAYGNGWYNKKQYHGRHGNKRSRSCLHRTAACCKPWVPGT
jgi:hypothetical protein